MVLTRFMDKHNYGTYKQIFYVYSTLLSVFTLGLPKSFGYFLPRMSMGEGKDLVNKLTRILLILGGVFSLFLYASSNIIAELLNNKELELGVKLFSVVPLFLMPTIGIESIYATYKQTYIASIYSIVSRTLLFLCVVIPAVFICNSYKEVVIGFVLSSFISFLLALYLKNRVFRSYTITQTAVSIREIFKFCLPLMGASIFNILINSTDQFFISRYFGTEAFAEFSNGAMELPFVGMIVGACSTVLLPVYSKINSDNFDIGAKRQIINIWNSVLMKIIMLIYPIIIFCMFYSEQIMVILYGKDYSVSGIYFFVMLFNNFFSVISCYPLLLALNKTQEYSIVYFLNFILLALFEYIVVNFVPDVVGVCVVSVLCLWIRVILFLFIIARCLETNILEMVPQKVLICVVSVSLFVGYVIKNYIEISYNFLSLGISFIGFYAIVMIIARLIKVNYFSIILPLLKK